MEVVGGRFYNGARDENPMKKLLKPREPYFSSVAMKIVSIPWSFSRS